MLSSSFFEDARALFERLGTPVALGRACEAAVRAPLPCLEDVRNLVEVSHKGHPNEVCYFVCYTYGIRRGNH